MKYNEDLVRNVKFPSYQLTNLMHKLLFHNKFIICLYMFRALLCSSSGNQIILYSIWYRHTLYVAVRCTVLSQPVHRTAT